MCFSASLCTSWEGHRQPVVFSQRGRERGSPDTLTINVSPQLAQSLPAGCNVTKTGKRAYPHWLPWDTHLLSVSAVTADSVGDGSYSLALWRALPECDNE